jgi:predicted negative regulator of RcsB-dependent stress response
VKGRALWNAGKKEEARTCFKKAIDVTNEMALKVIEVFD